MSKIIFITSQKQLKLEEFGIELILPNDYLLHNYPYLKHKKYIYDFENFNHSISYKEFINKLISKTDENDISLLVLWQTENLQEITEYNDNIQHKNVINLSNNSKIYDLIYRLESNSLLPSSEYEFTK